ncbi:hypothetical protein BH23DEI1_BH23DEI1_22360 [soil metagenome]|nr:tripartite tricarboxylate transporter TctB family protein [Trueperaceae bacterium]
MNTGLVGGLFTLVLTLVFWFGRGNWSALSAMFPNAVLITTGVLSVALVIVSLVRPHTKPVFVDGNRTRIVVTAIALLLWAWSTRWLGFYLAALIMFTGLMLYIASAAQPLTPRKSLGWVAIAAGELAILYFIFSSLLAVPLPAGLFAP